MAVHTDVKDLIAMAFNNKHGTDLSFTDLIVEELSTNPAIDAINDNTIISVTDGNGNTTALFYNRFDVKTVTGSEPINFQLPSNADGTIVQLLPLINRRLGIDLTPSEIVDGTYIISSGVVNIRVEMGNSINFLPGSSFTLRVNHVKHNGVVYCPTVDFTGTKGAYMPDVYQPANEHSSYSKYGNDRAMPALISSHIDYTPVAHILRNVCAQTAYSQSDWGKVRINNGNIAHVLSALRSVDGNPYTTQSTDISLYYTYIVYNGPTKDARGNAIRTYEYDQYPAYTDTTIEGRVSADIADISYDNVLIMTTLDGGNNSALKVAHLLFHYNGGI